MVNNILFCYDRDTHTGNDSFLQHKGKHSNNKEAYTDGSKSTGRKVGFAAVFMNIIKRGALPEEAFIHTTEITAIKTGRRVREKREHEMGNIYRLAEFNAGHREQQREPSNIKSDMTY